VLKGKTVIVTGAGRGIGRAIARRLGAAQAHVVLAARNERELDETRQALARDGGHCLAVRADLTRVEDVDRLVDESLARFGRIDGLVNNAGTSIRSDIEALEPEQFDAMVATNIRAVYLCCRAVWRPMAEAGGGVIVNISSLAGESPFLGFAVYGGTKAFVNNFSHALSEEGAARGIRVYCVAPGAVETQLLRGLFPDYPADQVLSADDVAAFVESLFSPAARHIDGQTIRIRRR
jgi:3-oxoacyl-[acyl-carrier protein] reductase